MLINIARPIILGGTIVLTVAITVWIKIQWKRIKKYFFGKNIIVLGASGVGKTTIHNFLRKGEITIKHKATIRKNVTSNRFKLRDLEIRISKGKDIGGTKSYIPEWKELFLNCDICIYVLDVRKVFEDDKEYIKLIDRHLRFINQWHEESGGKDIYVFGLFLDKIPKLNIFDNNDIQDFKEKISAKIGNSLMQANIKASKFFIGSMIDKKNSEFLIIKFLRRERG